MASLVTFTLRRFSDLIIIYGVLWASFINCYDIFLPVRLYANYRCASINSDPELIKSGLKSDKNKSFYTKIRLDPS